MKGYVKRHRTSLERRARALGYARPGTPSVVADYCVGRAVGPRGDSLGRYVAKHRSSLARLAKSRGVRSPRSPGVVASDCVRRSKSRGKGRSRSRSPSRKPRRKASPKRKPKRKGGRSRSPSRGHRASPRRKGGRGGAKLPSWKGRDFTYKATRKLGAGMDGTVYLARATPTDPGKPILIVAVKQAKASREARKSLETEWLVGRRLGVWPECHPMFPCMLELGPNGTWFSREFVEGETVEKAIKTWPRAQLFANVRALLGGLARAQRTAHEQAVVHYDGHTGNMLVRPDGTLVLIDFGRSCLMLRDARGLLKCQRGDKEKDIRTSLGFIEDDVLDRVGRFRDLPPDLRKAFNARSIEALMAALGPANVPPRAEAYAMDPHQIRQV